jgi:hypothetical protein
MCRVANLRLINAHSSAQNFSERIKKEFEDIQNVEIFVRDAGLKFIFFSGKLLTDSIMFSVGGTEEHGTSS